MIRRNGLIITGFNALQGRQVRTALRLPNLVEALSRFCYQEKYLIRFEMETAGYSAMGKILGHRVLSVNAGLAKQVSNEPSSTAEMVVDSLIENVLDRM